MLVEEKKERERERERKVSGHIEEDRSLQLSGVPELIGPRKLCEANEIVESTIGEPKAPNSSAAKRNGFGRREGEGRVLPNEIRRGGGGCFFSEQPMRG